MMYVHAGNSRIIRTKSIIGIFDIVTEDPGKKVYVSQLSVGALIGRSREGE